MPETNAKDELLYDAWCLIVNAYQGDWSQDPEWEQAAKRWCDEFQLSLSALA